MYLDIFLQIKNKKGDNNTFINNLVIFSIYI